MASSQTAMDALINEMVRDVEYHALKTLIDQAKERKYIPEYKRLYKELTGQHFPTYYLGHCHGDVNFLYCTWT